MFLALLIIAGLGWPLPGQDAGPQEASSSEDRAANEVDANLLIWMDFSADVYIADVNGNGVPDFVAVLQGGSGTALKNVPDSVRQGPYYDPGLDQAVARADFATKTLTLILRTVTEETERDLVYLITPGKAYEIPIAEVSGCRDMQGEEKKACLTRAWLEGEKPDADPVILDDLLSRSLPPNGYVRRYHAEEPVDAVLISTAGSSLHHFVSIEDAQTGDVAADVFVRAGGDVLLDLPFGTYRFRYVTGREWQGPDSLFGAEMDCFEVEQVLEFQHAERLALGPDGLGGLPPATSMSVECEATSSRI